MKKHIQTDENEDIQKETVRESSKTCIHKRSLKIIINIVCHVKIEILRQEYIGVLNVKNQYTYLVVQSKTCTVKKVIENHVYVYRVLKKTTKMLLKNSGNKKGKSSSLSN